jgi:hypothetical protein
MMGFSFPLSTPLQNSRDREARKSRYAFAGAQGRNIYTPEFYGLSAMKLDVIIRFESMSAWHIGRLQRRPP